MFTNTDCTIYPKTENGYDTVHISACYWHEVRADEIKKYGAEAADSVQIIIPLDSLDGYGTEWKIPENSYIAKGSPEAEVTDCIEPVINEAFRISSVTDNRSGSAEIRHITINAV